MKKNINQAQLIAVIVTAVIMLVGILAGYGIQTFMAIIIIAIILRFILAFMK